MGSSPDEVVSKFCNAANTKDLDTMVSLCAPNIVYRNDPSPDPVHGPDGVKAALEPMFKSMKAIEWITICQAAHGNMVLNERIDRFQMPNGNWMDIPLAGVFEVKDGKIPRWTDY